MSLREFWIAGPDSNQTHSQRCPQPACPLNGIHLNAGDIAATSQAQA